MLIATSNIAPHNLYLKGLHRKRFLPSIRLIESHCHVIDMHSKQDYRFKEQIQNQVFFLTSNRLSNQLIKASFNQLCHEEAIDKDKVDYIILATKLSTMVEGFKMMKEDNNLVMVDKLEQAITRFEEKILSKIEIGNKELTQK